MLGSYSITALCLWSCCVTTAHSTQTSANGNFQETYQVDVKQNGNKSCTDCDTEVKLYLPKSEIRQAGETAMFRCVVPLRNETVDGIQWTHNGHVVTDSSKYHVRLYFWHQGLFTQLKIRNVTAQDTGEVILHIPCHKNNLRANLTVVDPYASIVGEPCLSEQNCVDTNTFCLMPTRLRPGTCLCRRITPVYIRERSGCFPAAHGKDSCFHSEQCQFFVPGSQCLDDRCICPGNTVVAFGACLPALGLGSPCNDSNGRCSVSMSYCGPTGTCTCMQETYERNGTCHIGAVGMGRYGTGGIRDWRTWLCYILAFTAIFGVIGHAYCHRNAIANFCKHIFSR